MSEQTYKELTAAVRESGIPLPLQKELQRVIDKEFIENEEKKKSCTGATRGEGI